MGLLSESVFSPVVRILSCVARSQAIAPGDFIWYDLVRRFLYRVTRTTHHYFRPGFQSRASLA